MFLRLRTYFAERILCLHNIFNLLLLQHKGVLTFHISFAEKYGAFRVQIIASDRSTSVAVDAFAASASKCISINKAVSEYVERSCLVVPVIGHQINRPITFDDIELTHALCADGLDLMTGGRVPVPIQLLSYPDYNATQEVRLRPFNSNGMAAHVSYDMAVESALFEIIERDALMCRWYCKQEPRMFRIESVPASAQSMAHLLNKEGIDVYVLDIATDLKVPSVAILARTYVLQEERWIGASATRYSYAEAVLKAFDELHMLKPNLYMDAVQGNNAHYYRGEFAKHLTWFISGDVIDMPDSGEQKIRSGGELIRHLADHGIQNVFVYQYPRIAQFQYIRAVKCICPQLCPFVFSQKQVPNCGTRLRRYSEALGLSKETNEYPLFLN